MRDLGLPTTLALAVLGAGIATAAPVGPLAPESSRTTIKDGRGTTTAQCRNGTEVVSGGFAAPNRAYAGPGPYTEIHGAARKRDGAFEVSADNNSNRKGTLYAFAYCGEVGAIKVATAEKEIGGRKDGVAIARCPGGLTAISGGWYGKAPNGGRPLMVPFLSKRAGADGWKIGVENAAFNGSAVLVAEVYCADVDPPNVEVTDKQMDTLSQPRAGVSCNSGQQAVAGGFDAATPRGFSAGAEIYSSLRTDGGQRWKIAGINGGRARHLRVYAYCA